MLGSVFVETMNLTSLLPPANECLRVSERMEPSASSGRVFQSLRIAALGLSSVCLAACQRRGPAAETMITPATEREPTAVVRRAETVTAFPAKTKASPADSAAAQPGKHERKSGPNEARWRVSEFAVYALSRGKGVPADARAAFKELLSFFEADR